MQIDVVSDTVCPWCYIGKRRFERAIAQRPDLDLDVRWRPFQLNPTMPAEGMDRKEYMALKFGGAERANEIYQNIAEAAESEGLNFSLDLIKRTPNTLNSHRLIRWAATAGVQDVVVEELFRLYFTTGADISAPDVLAGAAKKSGMDFELVERLLGKEADVERIRSEDKMAREMGISGVPCFIIEQKYAVSGAQDPAAFLQVFDAIEKEQRETEAPVLT